MPMDIRAYFSKTPDSKTSVLKTPGSKTSKDTVNNKSKSRKRVFIDSDSEEEKSNKKNKAKKKPKKSNTNEDTSKYFKISNKDITSLLGSSPVKRVEQPKSNKEKKETSSELIDDVDWDDISDFPINEKNTEYSDSKTKDEADKHCDEKNVYEDKPSLPIETEISSNSRLHEMSPSPERTPIKNVTQQENPNKKLKLSSPKKETNLKSPEKKTVLTPVKRIKSPMNKKISKPFANNEVKSFVCKKVSPQKKLECLKVCNSLSNDPKYFLWVEKHKPSTLKQIIGQQGEKSNVNKLVKWLSNWHSNQSGKKKLTKPSPWAKDDSGAYFKAALLSGPPGVGKTTTAHLVCKELNMDMVEFNASDTRSKKSLQQEIKQLLSNNSLASYAQGVDAIISSKHVLVMDEVDGMAGNEDRGGVQELILLIKSSKVPVICMCNDRNHPKIRSLANYCFDLRFNKPRLEQIKGAMMSVCFKEGLKIKPDIMSDIITSTNQDIRLILNHLSILSAQSSLNMPITSKYVKLGPWDVLRKVFSKEEHKHMSIHDRCDLFFFDYSIAPLFVQENYLNVQPHSELSKTKKGKIALFAKAAQSIAYGDLVDNKIRSNSAWSLLPVQAVFSSLMPGEYLAGHMSGQINFPSWLGKNSRRGKIDRLCQEIQAHSRLRISGSKEAINLDYSYALREKVSRPLLKGTEGIEDSLSVMREYSLLREDIESLTEITTWPNLLDPFSKIDSKVKASFTRSYNKNPIVTHFSVTSAVKKGKGTTATDDIEVEGEGIEDGDDEEEDDDVNKDGMIMVKKKPSKVEQKEHKKKEGKAPRSGKKGGKKKKKNVIIL